MSFTSTGTNGNNVFYCHPEVSMKRGSRTGRTSVWRFPVLTPFISEDWLWKQRNVTYDTHTSPAPLAFQLESSQNKFCSLSFPPSRLSPIKAACVAHSPVLWLLSCRHTRERDSQLHGKSDSVPCPESQSPTNSEQGRPGKFLDVSCSDAFSPNLARVQAAQ